MQSLKEIEEQQKRLEIEKHLALQKAIDSGDSSEILKAQTYLEEKKKEKNNQKSFSIHPTDKSMGGYYEKPGLQLTDSVLDAMGNSTLIWPIINAKIKQVNQYLNPSIGKYNTGFVIEKKTSLFEEKKPLTKQEEREIAYLTEFVLNTGDRDQELLYDDVEHFSSKFLKDSFIRDAASSELVYTVGEEFKYYKHVDASTIRKASSYDQKTDINRYEEIKGYYPTYVQLINQTPQAIFYPHEMYYMVRNPSTSIRSHGYGTPELQILINIVTDFLNAGLYNGNRFKRGSMPKGFLIGKDININQDKAEEFLETFQSSIAGVQNAHRTLYLDGNQWEWVDLEKQGLDMSFLKYIEFLQRVACSVYSVVPEEINVPLEGTGNAGLGGDGKEEQYEYSRRMSLYPLLRKYARFFDRIVSTKSEGKYRFNFIYDVENEEKESERLIRAVQNYKTINEVREHYDLDPIPGGDIVLSPVYLESYMGGMAQEVEQKKEAEQEEAIKSITNPDNPFMKDLDRHVEQLFS